jgi:hypothetical protein
MYNLVMSAWDEAFEGEPFMISRDRCINAHEYTKADLAARFGNFNNATIEELKRLPTIFAYENGCKKDPKFGRITDIVERQKEVRIGYEIQEIDPFITFGVLEEMLFALDLGRFEINRNHWAVKDVDLARELSPRGIILPAWVRGRNRLIDLNTHEFDVALSFPGEARDYVLATAQELERYLGANRYFYDNNYRAQLARPSLDLLLQAIYSQRSKLIVVFIGGDYQRKDWCGIEWHAIRDIINRRERDRIMFVRLDEGNVEGVLQNDGYITAYNTSPSELAEMIDERVQVLNARE